MSNKRLFKKIYSKKINKEDNYNTIIKCIENKNRKFIWKKVLVPVSCFMLLFGIILININQNKNSFKSSEQIKDIDNMNDIYINNNLYSNTNNGNVITSFSSSDMIDDDVKKIDIDYEILIKKIDYSFLKDILVPEDLNNREYKEVYVKKNNNSGYNLLHSYEFIYKDNNDRGIVMLISDKYESNKNESLEDNIKISKINDVEVVIYQDESLYKVSFIYNDKCFNIRTNSVSKEELVNLLSSIIK